MERLTQSERETIINYSNGDRKWYADTTIPKHMRKFDKQGWKCTNTQYYDNGDIMAKTFEAPANAISILKANKKKRELSYIEKQELKERFKKH